MGAQHDVRERKQRMLAVGWLLFEHIDASPFNAARRKRFIEVYFVDDAAPGSVDEDCRCFHGVEFFATR